MEREDTPRRTEVAEKMGAKEEILPPEVRKERFPKEEGNTVKRSSDMRTDQSLLGLATT